MADDATPAQPPVIRRLGVTDYLATLTRMRAFTSMRVASRRPASAPVGDDEAGRPAAAAEADAADAASAASAAAAAAPPDAIDDEIWLTEHPPVYTLGRDGSTRHLHAAAGAGAIPVVTTERGGQITYHGPGQAIAYLLIDLRRRRLGVRDLVCRVEAAVIDCLAGYGIAAQRRPGAPGIYVACADAPGGLAKIASIGLKVSYGCSFHGVALNGRMDLAPFAAIDPCGYPGLRMTDVFTEAGAHHTVDPAALAERLGAALQQAIGGPAGQC